jgi:hypothetical protein
MKRKIVLIDGKTFASMRLAAAHIGLNEHNLSRYLAQGADSYTNTQTQRTYSLALASSDDIPEPDPFEPRSLCPRIDAELLRRTRARAGGALLGRVEVVG